jgi:hypothetical protein
LSVVTVIFTRMTFDCDQLSTVEREVQCELCDWTGTVHIYQRKPYVYAPPHEALPRFEVEAVIIPGLASVTDFYCQDEADAVGYAVDIHRGGFHSRISAVGKLFASAAMLLREECRYCGGRFGNIITVSSQDTVRCCGCQKYLYNAARTETGRPRQSLRTRPNVSPNQRARILLADISRCVICKRTDVPLEIGHMISVRDGRRQGLSDAELYSDENLCGMCAQCNSGLGGNSLPAQDRERILRDRRPALN